MTSRWCWASDCVCYSNTCQYGNGSNSGSDSGSRHNTSWAAGMFYYLIITLIIFRSPLCFKMVMAAAATATATAEGTAGGSRRGSRIGEGKRRAQRLFTLSFGPGILTVFIFDCLVHLYIHTPYKKKKLLIFTFVCLMSAFNWPVYTAILKILNCCLNSSPCLELALSLE